MKLKIDKFTGMIPRIAPKDLPDSGSTGAYDVNLAHGDIRALYNPYPVTTTYAAVRGMYTEDGTNFYTWPNHEVRAVRTPMINQTPRRFYYSKMDPNTKTWGLYNALTSGMSPTGGTPSPEYNVGVPPPKDLSGNLGKPYLNNYFDQAYGYLTSLPGYDTVKFKAWVWYEKNGKQSQKTASPQWELPYVPIAGVYLGLGVGDLPPYPIDPAYTDADAQLCGMVVITGTNAYTSTDQEICRLCTMNSVDATSTGMNKYGSISIQVQKDPIWPSKTDYLTFNWDKTNSRSYVYTLVNQWGEESAPSAPSSANFSPILGGQVGVWFYNDTSRAPQTKCRIYRTLQNSKGETDYYFVKEVDTGTLYTQSAQWVTDDVRDADLKEVCPTINWDMPPSDLGCVCALPNSFLAAFKGNQVYFSDPLHPYAWPLDYVQTLPYDVVGMIPYGGGLLVTTKAYPYFMYGAHPAAMTVQKINTLQSGVSHKSMCDLGHSVAYASQDGIVLVQGTTAQIDTSLSLWTRNDWQQSFNNNPGSNPFYPSAYALTDLCLGAYEGAILGIFPYAYGFIIRLDEGNGTLCRTSMSGLCTFLFPNKDKFYIGQQAGQINEYDYIGSGGSAATASWLSKEFWLSKPVNFGVLQVVCSPNLTNVVLQPQYFYVTYSDTKTEQGVTTVWHNTVGPFIAYPSGGNQTFTFQMPSGFKGRKLQLWSVGINAVQSIELATNHRELNEMS